MTEMRKKLLLIGVAALFFCSCKKEVMKSSFESKILGNWLVIDSVNKDKVVEWGIFYVTSIKLYSDKTFRLNLGRSIDDSSAKTGTWVLNGNKDSITFYTMVSDIGMTLKDTSGFHISIDPDGKLILKNNWTSIMHIKWDN
jgi:hypothetical protein